MSEINTSRHQPTESSQKKVNILTDKISRRDLINGAVKTAAIYGVASYINNDLLGNRSLVRHGIEKYITQTELPDPKVEPQYIERIPVGNDEFINEIESRLGLRLVSLREAYGLMGKQFNEHDHTELSNILPMRWDHERATMVEEFFGYLPNYFHEPDGEGNPLLITLTNFNSESTAGSFHLHDSQNLMKLDHELFSSEDRNLALSILTHECIHYMQDLGYSKMEQEIQRIFGKSFKTVFEETIQKLRSLPRAESDEVRKVRGFIEYGVLDSSKGDVVVLKPSTPQKNTGEFEAVLGQIYIYGEEYFLTHMNELFGEKSQQLYDYMKTSIFGGHEYIKYPLSIDHHKEKMDIRKGLNLYERISKELLLDSATDALRMPEMNSDDPYFAHLYNNDNLQFREDYQADSSSYWKTGEIFSYSDKLDEPPIEVRERKDQNGNVVYQKIDLWVDSDGNRLRFNSSESMHQRGALQNIAKKLFRLPNAEFSWRIEENKRYGRIEQGECIYNGKKYKLHMREFGDISYEVTTLDYVDK